MHKLNSNKTVAHDEDTHGGMTLNILKKINSLAMKIELTGSI